MSFIHTYAIKVGKTDHLITVTCQRVDNDHYGNPIYSIQVWTTGDDGHIWYPKLKGFRDRKDQTYRLQSYNIQDDIKNFVTLFANELTKRLQEI